MVKTLIPAAVAVVAIVAISVPQGIYTERWGKDTSGDRDLYVARLANIPKDFGDWRGKDDEREVDKRVLERAGHDGYVSRTYRNIKTNQEVSISLVCGHPQHIAEHTPDQCYVAAGFTQPSTAQAYRVTMNNGESAEFRTTTFVKESQESATRLKIFWAWRTATEPWSGPSVNWAKIKFSGKPALYKLYVIDTTKPVRGRVDREGPAVAFIREVLPQIDAYLSGKKTVGADESGEPGASGG